MTGSGIYLIVKSILYAIFGVRMFGVSPAYFFSRYTTEFHIRDYIDGLEWLAKNSFTGFQPEVFKPDRLNEWRDGVRELADAARDLGLSATQFVAHFLLSTTRDREALCSNSGIEEMKVVAEITSQFPNCKTVTLPISPFSDSPVVIEKSNDYRHLWDALCRKLLAMDEIVKAAGLRLAIEIVPGSLLGGTEGLLRFYRETGNSTIGYNFDTGHAYSSKECLLLIPAKLAGRIYGTHLKDNFGNENLALLPGKGSISWDHLIDALLANGYEGSFDLEIASSQPDKVFEDYLQGKARIMSALSASQYRRQKEEMHL